MLQYFFIDGIRSCKREEYLQLLFKTQYFNYISTSFLSAKRKEIA